MKRIDYSKIASYKDIFSKTYYVSNEHSEQTIKFSEMLHEKFKNNKEGLFLGVTGGVDPFMNFALNSNANEYVGIDINPVAIELIEKRLELASSAVDGLDYLTKLFGASIEDINNFIEGATTSSYLQRSLLISLKNKVTRNFDNIHISLSKDLLLVLDLYFGGDVRFLKHMRNTYKSSFEYDFGWLNPKSFLESVNNIISNLIVGQCSLTDIFDYEPLTEAGYLKVIYITNVHHYLDKTSRIKFALNLKKIESKQGKEICIVADGASKLLTASNLENWLLEQEYRAFSGNLL